MFPGDSSIAIGAMARTAPLVLRLETRLAATPAKVTMAGPCHATPKHQVANMLQPTMMARLTKIEGPGRSTVWRRALAASSGLPATLAAAAKVPKKTCGADAATAREK